MNTAQQLATRFRGVFLDSKWIANTNYKEQLSEIGFQQATQQIGTLNTIALLTYHINYYLAGVLQVLKGGALTIRDKYSFYCPPIPDEAAWQVLKTELLDNAETFAQQVEQMSASQLAQVFVKEEYGDYNRNIEAMIEHAYYHLGQIVLIRKMLH